MKNNNVIPMQGTKNNNQFPLGNQINTQAVTPVEEISTILVENQKISEPKLIISKEIHQKINLLCNLFSNTEWSGVLFYDYTGEFGVDMVLTIKDILIKDLGDAASTSYDVDASIPAFMVKNKLVRCKMGHIHSHHSMSTFFSGTDKDTLRSEGNDSIHFLSLIVNNDNTYNAKMTVKTETVTNIKIIKDTTATLKSFNNIVKERKFNTEDTQIEKKNIIEYCNVVIEFEDSTILNEVKEIYKELTDNKRSNVIVHNTHNIVLEKPFDSDIVRNTTTQTQTIIDNNKNLNERFTSKSASHRVESIVNDPEYNRYILPISTVRADDLILNYIHSSAWEIIKDTLYKMITLDLVGDEKFPGNSAALEKRLNKIRRQFTPEQHVEILNAIIWIMEDEIETLEAEYPLRFNEDKPESEIIFDLLNGSLTLNEVEEDINLSLNTLIKVTLDYELAKMLSALKVSESELIYISNIVEAILY